MAKISVGKALGKSKLTVDLNLAHNSQFEIEIGDGHDMSTQEIKVLERDEPQLREHLSEFDNAVATVSRSISDRKQAKRLADEAEKFRKSATTTVDRKKSVPVSTKGLVDAAKSIGAAATPILVVASKVVDILRRVQGL